jgi:hypothetical protein
MLYNIFEQKGAEFLIIKIYKKFLELGKDADPGIPPEVEDAKKRLASLQSQ